MSPTRMGSSLRRLGGMPLCCFVFNRVPLVFQEPSSGWLTCCLLVEVSFLRWWWGAWHTNKTWVIRNFKQTNFRIYILRRHRSQLIIDFFQDSFGQWQIIFGILSVVYLFGAVIYLLLGTGELQRWNSPESEKEKEPESYPLRNNAA